MELWRNIDLFLAWRDFRNTDAIHDTEKSARSRRRADQIPTSRRLQSAHAKTPSVCFLVSEWVIDASATVIKRNTDRLKASFSFRTWTAYDTFHKTDLLYTNFV